jgi:hypothetical protein
MIERMNSDEGEEDVAGVHTVLGGGHKEKWG